MTADRIRGFVFAVLCFTMSKVMYLFIVMILNDVCVLPA